MDSVKQSQLENMRGYLKHLEEQREELELRIHGLKQSITEFELAALPFQIGDTVNYVFGEKSGMARIMEVYGPRVYVSRSLDGQPNIVLDPEIMQITKIS